MKCRIQISGAEVSVWDIRVLEGIGTANLVSFLVEGL